MRVRLDSGLANVDDVRGEAAEARTAKKVIE
jgi:hypothetical protein